MLHEYLESLNVNFKLGGCDLENSSRLTDAAMSVDTWADQGDSISSKWELNNSRRRLAELLMQIA